MAKFSIVVSSHVVIEADNETRAFGKLMDAANYAHDRAADHAQLYDTLPPFEIQLVGNIQAKGTDVQKLPDTKE